MDWIFQLDSRGVVEVYARKAMHLSHSCIVGGNISYCTVIVAVMRSTVISFSLKLFLLYPSKAFDLFLAGNLLIGKEDRTDIVYDVRSFLTRSKGFIGLAMRFIVIAQPPTTLK